MARISYNAEQALEAPFADFAPDADITTRGILLDMAGARSTVKGFESLPSPVKYGDAPPLSGTDDSVRGAAIGIYSGGVQRLIAGTKDHLWAWNPIGTPVPVGAPTMIDTAVTPFNVDHWRFFQFGDDVIALSSGAVPQVASGPLGTFADMRGVTPDMVFANVGCAAAGAVMLFKGQQWFSSAFGIDQDPVGGPPPSAWTPDVQTGAATGFLYDYPGAVTACAPFYRTVIAFKANAMWAGSVVGPPDWWGWQLISDEVGTLNQEAVVVMPDSVAFLGTDDFYITTGSVPIRIPNNVKEWFFDQVDPAFLNRTIGWYDPTHSIVCWHAVSLNPPVAGVPDFYVMYNVRARRWAKGNFNVLAAPTPATTPEHPACIFFGDDSVPVEMTGPAQNMILATGWIGDPAALTQLLRVRAKYRQVPTDQRLVVYSVNQLGDIPAPAPPAVPVLANDTWFNMRVTQRYHQVWLSTQGPCEVMGLAYEGRTAGVR